MEFKYESPTAAGGSPTNPNQDITRAIIEQRNILKDLVTSGDKITKGSISEYLNPELMKKRGYVNREGNGANWRNPSEFGDIINNTEQTYTRWITAVYTLLLPYQQLIDPSVRTEINRVIRNEDQFNLEQQENLINISKGLFLVSNMNLNFLGCNGDVNAWSATPDKGGMISADEGDRLSFDGLHEQLKLFPGMGKTMELLDIAVAQNIGNENFSIDDFIETLNSDQIGLGGEQKWKVNIQKQLALMWYRMLGFPDIRKFAYMNEVYGQKMPHGERLNHKDRRMNDQYNEAIKTFSFEFGYVSPYYFLMDPCSMVAGVLKNYPDLIADIRIRMKNDKSPHNIFNLGWRPPAWHLMEKMLGKSITTPELNKITLSDFVPGGLTGIDDTKWAEFLEKNNGLLQKHAIKFAEKAGVARGAFMNILGLDPKEFGKFYGSVSDFLRDVDEIEAHDPNNLFTRNEIMPLLTEAVIAAGKWANKNIKWGYNSKFYLPISRTDMRFLIAQIRVRLSPINPFSDYQVKELEEICLPQSVLGAGLK